MDIFEKVIAIISGLAETDSIQAGHYLQEDIGLDSLNMVTLLIELEEKFGIELDESDMNPYDLNTVQSVADLVGRYLGDETQ